MVSLHYKILNTSAFEAALKSYIAGGDFAAFVQDVENLYVIAESGPTAGIAVRLSDLTLPTGVTTVEFVVNLLVDQCSCEYRLFLQYITAIRRAFDEAFDDIIIPLVTPSALAFALTFVEQILDPDVTPTVEADFANAFATAYALAIAAGSSVANAISAGYAAARPFIAAVISPGDLAIFDSIFNTVIYAYAAALASGDPTAITDAYNALISTLTLYNFEDPQAIAEAIAALVGNVSGRFNLGIIPHGCSCPPRVCN